MNYLCLPWIPSLQENKSLIQLNVCFSFTGKPMQLWEQASSLLWKLNSAEEESCYCKRIHNLLSPLLLHLFTPISSSSPHVLLLACSRLFMLRLTRNKVQTAVYAAMRLQEMSTIVRHTLGDGQQRRNGWVGTFPLSSQTQRNNDLTFKRNRGEKRRKFLWALKNPPLHWHGGHGWCHRSDPCFYNYHCCLWSLPDQNGKWKSSPPTLFPAALSW